jgi:hypothetical protein
MHFSPPDDSTELAQSLRDAEPQAPKALRPLLIQAAQFIEHIKRVAPELAQSLDVAASMRVGQMDSQSRADEVAREVRLSLQSVSARLRELS